MVQCLREIVQVYCGEYQSFAVDNLGDIYAWGLNKGNALLINQPDKGLVKTVVLQPMKVVLPEYFMSNKKVNVVQNNQAGVDIYMSALKPVISEASLT